jgi:hypothetical protein
MEPEVSLLFSQETTTKPYPESVLNQSTFSPVYLRFFVMLCSMLMSPK